MPKNVVEQLVFIVRVRVGLCDKRVSALKTKFTPPDAICGRGYTLKLGG